MVARTPARVDRLRFQQRADLVQRERRSRYDRPLTVTRPDVGASRPTINRMVVDFPAPFGPRKPVTRPSGTMKLRSSAATVDP